jgi:hypothetical protein
MATQANPWDNDPIITPAAPSRASGPVYGAPADPFKVRDQQLQEQANSRATRAEDRASRAEQRAEQERIPAAAATGLQENLKTLRGIEGAIAALKARPESIGTGTGMLGDTVTQWRDPDGTSTRAAIGKVGAYTIHDLSGAAVSASEAPRFTPFVPTIQDRPEVAAQKLEGFRKELMNQIREANDFYSPANGYRPYETPGLKEILTPQAEAPPAPQLGGAGTSSLPPSGDASGVPAGLPTPGAGGENGGGLAPGGGTTRQVDNPVLAGVREEYKRRLAAGQTAEQIIDWAKSTAIDPSAYPSIRAQVDDFKRTRRPLSEYNTQALDDMIVPMSGADQRMNNAAQSDLGAFGIAAGDAASMGTLDNIVGATGGNAERARLGMDQVAQDKPVASMAGSLAGGLAGAFGIEAGLAGRGLGTVARGLTADSLYGAGYGAGSSDYNADGGEASLADRGRGAALGGGLGLVGSYLGSKVASGVGALARGVSKPSVQAMNDVGAVTTIGQQVGQSGRVGAAVKGIEDRLAGLPVVGDVINARRAESYNKFNTGAFDKALAPIADVPGLSGIAASVDGKIGEEAIQEAQGKVQQAFGAALQGKSVTADLQGAMGLTDALLKAASIPGRGHEVNDSIAAILEPYMAPGKTRLSGEDMQTISQELRQLKAGYKNDPLKKRIGDAITATEDAMFGMFRRQTPEVLPAYNAAKAAYRRVSILADAVNKAKNQPDNMFTPAQLGQADRANTIKYEGPIAAASGKSQFNDYQKAAQEVLPNKVPDSGTAGRWLLPALAGVGAGAGGGVGYATGDPAGGALKGASLAAMLAGAYSKAGQRALIRAAQGTKSQTAKRLLNSPATQRAIQAGAATAAIGANPQ